MFGGYNVSHVRSAVAGEPTEPTGAVGVRGFGMIAA